jgi:hypothetical protein
MATNRVHYFHAGACAFGGYFDSPIEANVAPQASLSLSPAGGYGSARAENFNVEGLLSYKSASTQVSGGLSKKPGGGWITLATSTVEGLDILGVITIDRLSAQISTDHPLEGDNPKVTFLGTSFENLKIAGCPVNVTLDLGICDQGNGNDYPSGPCVSDDRFLNRVAEQYRRINDSKNMPDWVKDRSVPDWIEQRYQWDSAKAKKSGSVLGSVVKETTGKFPGTPFGNVFELPDIGRVFLGELLVDYGTFRLTMVRVEMGCRAHGSLAGPTSETNGTTRPPG